jgi:plastocyanin
VLNCNGPHGTLKPQRHKDNHLRAIGLASQQQPPGGHGRTAATAHAVRHLWAFSLKGQVNPLWPPPPAIAAGPGGAVADGVDKVKIGDNNVEYAYWPARTRIKAGTTVTFTNVGDIPHTATAFDGNVSWRSSAPQVRPKASLSEKDPRKSDSQWTHRWSKADSNSATLRVYVIMSSFIGRWIPWRAQHPHLPLRPLVL